MPTDAVHLRSREATPLAPISESLSFSSAWATARNSGTLELISGARVREMVRRMLEQSSWIASREREGEERDACNSQKRLVF